MVTNPLFMFTILTQKYKFIKKLAIFFISMYYIIYSSR